MTRARDLKEGDLVDLEGDGFADPDKENEAFVYGFQRVEGSELETPECLRIDFEGVSVGFPPDHWLRVAS